MRMKNISRILFLLAAVLTFAVGCKEESYPEYEYQSRLVRQPFLNSQITIFEGMELEIQGFGFVVGDKIIFRGAEQEYSAEVIAVEDSSAMFMAPNMPQGTYVLYIGRGEKIQKVATITVWITTSLIIPEKEGCSLRGIVCCADQPIEGVWVSDGVNFTQTDKDGCYWLKSDKRFGYVFVCVPSGYMPATGTNAVPGYWKSVSIDPYLSEQCNFDLRKVDNSKHQILFATDLHLANRSIGTYAVSDLDQFKKGFIADSEALLSSYGLDNSYLITMGDLTWDAHWYRQNYMPEDYVKTMKGYPVPVFNCMGNHDNNPYVQSDMLGSKVYRNVVAPSYYSFDLGDVHYIVIDNIEWINTGGTNGIVGERNYVERVDDVQLNWLKEDLSHIADKSKPVVVCTHCQLHSNRNDKFEVRTHMANTKTVLACFEGFTNVHILTGHSHYNMIMPINNNIFEHNVAAVCETWWQSTGATNLNGRGICRDGTPAGYYVFEVEGSNIKWYYKSIGFDKSLQFRAYDMNNVKQAARLNWHDYIHLYDPNRTDYSTLEDNVIYINVWDWDPQWKIEVTEAGKSTPLTVTRVFDRDPLHTLTTDVPLSRSGALVDGLDSVPTSHMWKVVTSSATSNVTIKVTNRFGEVFTQEMTGRNKRNSFSVNQYIK